MEDDDDALRSPLIVPPLTTITPPSQPSDDSTRRLKPSPSASNKSSSFELPQGWKVQKVPRLSGSHIDKYYFEEGSEKKFRSLKEVERYVRGQEYTPSEKPRRAHKPVSKCGQRKTAVSGGRMLSKPDDISNREQLTIEGPSSAAVTSHLTLPDGWVVKEVPSKKYQGQTTKVYYEQGTGQKFRTLHAVKKYISDKDIIVQAPLAKTLKWGNSVMKSGSRKKSSEHEKDGSTSDYPRKHTKISWVLDDDSGTKWNAFVGPAIIPESTRHLWEERFQSSINGNSKNNDPQ